MDISLKLQICCLLVIRVIYVFGALSDTYIGCFDDIATDAVFRNKFEMMNLTPSACRTRCNTGDNRYIGLWGGINCWCSDIPDLETRVARLNNASCNSRCIGNQSLFCGGPNRNDNAIYSVYSVCPKGTYGLNCKKPCNCKDNNSCTASGVCPNSECAQGWRHNMTGDSTRRQCSVDINECDRECNRVNKTDCYSCSANEECNNTEGSFECKCKKGYNRNGGVCKDINECERSNTNNCSQLCFNKEGGYNCSCRAGYLLEGLYDCKDIDECSSRIHRCNHTCRNTVGNYTCECRTGFLLDDGGYQCNDIDECRMNASICSQECENTAGSYKCHCRTGYELQSDKYTCNDIDECRRRPFTCSQECKNTPGSYKCYCRTGYEVQPDNYTCNDIDECSRNVSKCNQNCTNTFGWYNCSCFIGFKLIDNFTCTDIDECSKDNGNCQHFCKNTVGSFDCSCWPGYREIDQVGTKYNCTDIDECSQSPPICEHTCNNTDGGYICSCRSGFDLDYNNHSCNDIDECEAKIHQCSQFCENTNGNYSCKCEGGYYLAGKYNCLKNNTGVILAVGISFLILAILVMIIVLLKCKRMFPFDKPRFWDALVKKEHDEMSFENGRKELKVFKETKLLPNIHPKEKTPSGETQLKPARNTCVVVKDFKRYIEKIEAADGFEEEFREIPMVSEISYEFAQAQGLKPKNRFKNILPYDNNRVILDEINEDPLTSYINASFIKGYNKNDKIIASHGPTSNTLDDFWRMIWKYDVTVIIMVTKCIEDGKSKCEQYWPLEGSRENCSLTISVVSTENWPDYIITHLKISKDNISRRIVHLLFTDWPDHGVPDHATSLLSFRRAARNVIAKDKYFLVHCSAGVGRTGTFLAIDFLLQQAKHKGSIDVYKYLQELRDQRMNAVQTLDQYEFIHKALLEALTLGETVIPCSSLSDHRKYLANINPLTGKTFIQTEFDMLQEMHPPHSAEASSGAVYQNNFSKNRDSRIIPGDKNRVFLTTATSGIGDYINAVFVSNYRRKDAFISTELPLPETLTEFWLMTLNYKCKLVVYLDTSGDLKDIVNYLLIPQKTKLFINRHKFWTVSFEPKALSDICSSYSVAVSEAPDDDEDIYANVEEIPAYRILILRFQLSAKLTTAARLLPQIHEQIKTSAGSIKDNGPVVIISRDGVNPTGQFIAVSNLLDMASSQHEIDVFSAVHNIKRTQPHFITSLEEYKMIYDALEEEGDNSTYANF